MKSKSLPTTSTQAATIGFSERNQIVYYLTGSSAMVLTKLSANHVARGEGPRVEFGFAAIGTRSSPAFRDARPSGCIEKAVKAGRDVLVAETLQAFLSEGAYDGGSPVGPPTVSRRMILPDAMMEVEKAHFRTVSDTGAAEHALLVWNALRGQLGLPRLTVEHLAKWDESTRRYETPEDSKLLVELWKRFEGSDMWI